jgi:hypothetical protein
MWLWSIAKRLKVEVKKRYLEDSAHAYFFSDRQGIDSVLPRSR